MALKVGELYGTLKLDDKDFQQGLSRSKSGFDGLKNVIGRGVQTAAKAFAGTTVAVAGLGLAALKVGLDYNRMQQSSRAALSTLLGGAEAANAQMDKLDDFARNSPFAKQVFIQAQQQLLGFGVAAENVIPTLDAVQNAVAAVGGNNDQVSSVTYALAQMQGQGKLTGETLNQLGQYGIDAATILGKEMGKSGEEIRKLASKPGGIPVDQVFKPLTDGLMKRFGGATDNIKQQFDGAADRIKGAFRDIGSALAAPFIDPNGGGRAVEWTNKVADAMRALETKIKPLVTLLINRFNPQLEKITPILDKVRGSINAWDISKVNGQLDAMSKYAPLISTVAAGLFAMGTNVPVLASLGLTLNPVVAALGALALTSPQVRDAFGQIFASLQPLLPVLGALGIQLADVLVHAIETLAPAVGDLAAGFGEAGVSLLTGLTPGMVGLLTAATPLIDVVASLATFVGQLPAPLLAAGVAMTLLKGNLSPVATGLGDIGKKFQQSDAIRAWNAGLTASSTALIAVNGIAGTASAGIARVGTALLGAFGGPIGLAITGITVALGAFITSQGQAKQRSEEFRTTLDQTTGAITEQTRALMFEELMGSSNYEQIIAQANRLGLSMQDLVAITLGETTPALEEMYARLDENRAALEENANSGDRFSESAKAMRGELEAEATLRSFLGGTIEKNSEELEYNREKLDAVRGAQSDAQGAAERHTNALRDQIDAQRDAAGAAISQAEAALRVRDAEDRASEALKAHTELQKTGKASTEELERSSRNLETQNLNLVRAWGTEVEAMAKNNVSAKELDATIKTQRETFIKQQEAMGLSRQEAEKLADTYGLIPNRVETEVRANTAAAREGVERFIWQTNQRKATITITTKGEVSRTGYGGASTSYADGGIRSRAWGALDEPQIQPGRGAGLFQVSPLGPVNWAEGETQGEAFIPFAPSKRRRAIDIWEETGKRLGQFPVRQFANGSFDGQSTRPLAPVQAGPAVAGRLLSDADVRAIADAVREGAAGGVRDGMDGAGGGVSTLVRAGHGQ